MKILFVGVFSKFSNNIPQYNSFLKKNIAITKFDYRKKYRNYKKPLENIFSKCFYTLKLKIFPQFIRKLFYKEKAKKKVSSELKTIVREKRFDLVILSKIEIIDPEIIDYINIFSKTYYYFVDPMKTARFIDAKEYVIRANLASATFSDVVKYFKKFNKKTQQIVQGIDPNQYKPKTEIEKKKYDVVFAGTLDRKRKKIINFLKKNGIKIHCYGKNTVNGSIYNKELMKIYSESKIILNLTRQGNGFSVRVFEAMGSGSLLISEYCEDLELFFSKGKNIEWFENEQELLELINFYLINEKNRKIIVQKSKQLIWEKFKWSNQIKKIMDFVELKC